MAWLIVIAAGLAIMGLLIWYGKVTITVYFRHDGAKGALKLEVKFLAGIIRYRTELPFSKIVRGAADLPAQERKEENPPDGLFQGLKEIKGMLASVIQANDTIKKFIRNITVEKFEWSTAVGTGDAAATGVIAGGLWGLKAGVAGVMGEFMVFRKKPALSVTPYFQYKVAGTMLTCMVTFRAGKAISAGVKLLAKWREKKGSFPAHLPSISNKEL